MSKYTTRRDWLSTSLGSCFIVGFAGCVDGDDSDDENRRESVPDDGFDDSNSGSPEIEMVEQDWGVIDVRNDEERYGIEGTIQNVSEQEAEYVRLRATFLDEDDVVLEQPWTDREFVGSEEKALFELFYREQYASAPPNEVDRYEVDINVESNSMVINGDAIATEEVEWQQMDQDAYPDPVYEVTGLATNTTDEELPRVMFYANFYEQETIVYDYRDSVRDLPPGHSYEFSLAFRGGGEYEADEYKLNIAYRS